MALVGYPASTLLTTRSVLRFFQLVVIDFSRPVKGAFLRLVILILVYTLPVSGASTPASQLVEQRSLLVLVVHLDDDLLGMGRLSTLRLSAKLRLNLLQGKFGPAILLVFEQSAIVKLTDFFVNV